MPTLAATNLQAQVGLESDHELHLEVYGQETKFEILRNAFEAAVVPAKVSDFEVYNPVVSNRTQRCVFAWEDKP